MIVMSSPIPTGVVAPPLQTLLCMGDSFFMADEAWNVGLSLRNTSIGLAFAEYLDIDGVPPIGDGGGFSGMSWDNFCTGAPLAGLQSALNTYNPACIVGAGTSNSVFNEGLTQAQTLANMVTWVGIVRAIQPKIPIIILGTIPKWTEIGGSYSTVGAANGTLISIDAAIAASPSTYGVQALAYARGTGGPYAFGQTSTNLGTATVYTSNASAYTDTYVHPSISGSQYIGQCIANAIQALV